MGEFITDNNLNEEECFKRDCLVRDRYRVKVVKGDSLKAFITWIAKQRSMDIRLRAAKIVAIKHPYWEEIRQELLKLADMHREKVEPILKEQWEKLHGKHIKNGPRSRSEFIQAARSMLG